MAEVAGYRRVNYYELCRLCTSSEGTKVHLFREEGRRRSLPNKIQTCLPLSVQEEDSLPKIICSMCVEKLEGYYEFRQSCINAEAMLESYFTSLRYSEDLSREGKVSVYVKEEPNKKKDESQVQKQKPMMSQPILQTMQMPICSVASSIVTSTNNTISTANQTSQANEGISLPSAIQILTDQDGNRLTQYKVQVQGGVPSLVPAYSSVQVPLSGLQHMKAVQVSHDVTRTSQVEHVSVSQPSTPALVASVTLAPQNHNDIFASFNSKERFSRTPIAQVSEVVKMKNISIVEASGMESGMAQIRLDPEQLSQLMAGSGLQLSVGGPKLKVEDIKRVDTESNEQMSLEPGEINGEEQDELTVDNENELLSYECNLCDKVFKRNEHLVQHKRSHSGHRPFACSTCGKAFSRKEHLIRHEVSHTGKKMYKCNVCQKNFSRKDNLHKHKKTHGINGPHVCETCGKSFVVKHYYAIHRAMHEKEKNGEAPIIHRCDLCPKAYNNSVQLEQHRARHRAKQKKSQQTQQNNQNQPQQQEVQQVSQLQQHQNQQQQQQQQQQQTILTSFPINAGLATINPHALLTPNLVQSSGNMVHIGNTSYVCTTELLDQYRRLHS